MDQEELDRFNKRWNRFWIFLFLLAIAVGIVWAIRADNDLVAGITCFVAGIGSGIAGYDPKKNPDAIGNGIITALILLVFWFTIKYLIMLTR